MNIFRPRKNERGHGEGLFRMEFPLSQWIVAASYKILGKHIELSRGFMFIVGLLSICGLYVFLLALFKNGTIAIIGAWGFNFSPSFYYYTINPLPDNLALCCSIWGIAFFLLWYNDPKYSKLIWSALFLALGTLCKLPFVLYYVLPLSYFIFEIFQYGIKRKTVFEGIPFLLLICLPAAWYLTVIPEWENAVIKGIMNEGYSFHTILDYLQHNLFSTLPELLLNYGSVPFFILGFYYLFKRVSFKNPPFKYLFLWSLSILAFFFFEISMIAKIHDYYLFLFFPLLFSLVGYGAYHFMNSNFPYAKYLSFALLILLPLLCQLRMQDRWNLDNPGFNKDLLTHKTLLREAVPDDALVIAGNDESHFIFFYYIDKKGWGFHKDQLSEYRLKKWISEGAEYLYTDSEIIKNNPSTKKYIDALILEKGSVSIYKLKSINPTK